MTKEQKEAFEKNVKAKEAQMAKNKALNDAYNAGKNAVDAKQWDVAIESLNKAAELDPKQGAVWTSVGRCLCGQGAGDAPGGRRVTTIKPSTRIKRRLRSIPPTPGFITTTRSIWRRTRSWTTRKSNLAKAAELDPPGAGKYYYNLGALLVNSGQNDAAMDEFKKAIDADPNYADAQYQYGVALSAKATTDPKGNIIAPPGAVEALQKYLDLKPDGVNAQSAKEMIAALGAQVNTNYSNPNAPKGKNSKTTKKQQ